MAPDPATVALHYRDTGSGTPLVILHGLFGSARNWHTIAQQLGRSWRVITVDLRNHGESPHTGTMSYADMAADVFALLERLQLSSCTLIGHSMGGKVAMVAALAEPQRFERLVVVDIAPVSYGPRFAAIVDAMAAVTDANVGGRAEAAQRLEAAEPDAAVRNFLLHNLVLRDGRYAWRINLPAIRAALPDINGFPELDARYECPTLFLRGEHSQAVLPGHGEIIRRYFPNATVTTVAGAGHWPHADAPQPFLRLLTDFLIL